MDLGSLYISPLAITSHREVLLIMSWSPFITWSVTIVFEKGTCTVVNRGLYFMLSG